MKTWATDVPTGVPRALEDLGFHGADLPPVRRAVRAHQGLVLVVGPRRSGLSTTLAALHSVPPACIDAAGSVKPADLLLDPPPSPAATRRAIAAIPAGRRVFSSLALERAPHVFGHFRAMGLSPARLARDLLIVVAQQLVARLCPACRLPDNSAELRQALAQATNSWLDGTPVAACVARAGGCAQCGGSGYAGHLLVYECLVVDSAVRAMAELGAIGLAMEQALFAHGSSLWDHGLRSIAQGLCSLASLRCGVREPV